MSINVLEGGRPRLDCVVCLGDTIPVNREHYRVTLVESEEGFAVWCDDLPGCCSQGATRAEALENIRESIRDYLAARPDVEAHFGSRIQHAEVTV